MIQARKGAFVTGHFPLTDIPAFVEKNAMNPFTQPLSVWNKYLQAGALPVKQKMPFSDFRGWHNKLVLSKFESIKGMLHFQLVGEAVKDLFGQAVEPGKSFADAPVSLFPHYLSHFKAIQDYPVFGAGYGSVPFEGREFLRFYFIDLPATDNAGTISHLYSFFYPDQSGKKLGLMWQNLQPAYIEEGL